MRDSFTRHLPILTVIALFATAFALHLHTAIGADGPEVALQRSIEQRGAVYAGDCAGTSSPRDVGASCSRLVAEEDGVQAYLVGRTFSEFSHWLFLTRAGDGRWLVKAEIPLDFNAATLEVPWP